MSFNRNYSAKVARNPEDYFECLRFIEERFLKPLSNGNKKIYKVLVIGAVGFTFGLDDKGNEYTYVDIDDSLQ